MWDATTNLPIPELPSHKSVGQQLSQSFYIFPHPTHSNWKPRKDAIPATPVTAITRGAVGRHAKIGKTRVASHTHWRKSTPNAPPPPQSTTMTHFPPQSNTSHSRNPSLRGIAIERHAISSTHHNNRSYKYCLYISPFRTLWSQQALRQLFKRHGNYMKLEYGTARSKRPRHVESEFSTSVLVSDTCRRGDEDQPSPPDQHTPFLLVTAPLSLTRTMMIAIIFNSDLELWPR